MNTIDLLRRVLNQSRSIAVVGLSAEWHRPSFFAAKYMQQHGYRIVPVNPRYAKTSMDILGERCYAELSDIPYAVDMVDVFRRTEDVLPIARQAVQIGARCRPSSRRTAARCSRCRRANPPGCPGRPADARR